MLISNRFQKIKDIWETCFNAVHSVIEEDDVKEVGSANTCRLV